MEKSEQLFVIKFLFLKGLPLRQSIGNHTAFLALLYILYLKSGTGVHASRMAI
jgi:hypothetical protein